MRTALVIWPSAALLALGTACDSSTVPIGHGDEEAGGNGASVAGAAPTAAADDGDDEAADGRAGNTAFAATGGAQITGDQGTGDQGTGDQGTAAGTADGPAGGANASESGSGGALAAGGTSAVPSAGGHSSSGGERNTGGTSTPSTSGGNPGSGGERDTGGAPNSGGALGTGGASTAPAVGGTESTGGNQSSGGSQAAGGSGSTPQPTGGTASTAGSGGIATTELFSEQPRDTNPDIDDAAYGSFISDINQFGLDLFHILAADDNLIYSPLSTAYALGMTVAGARENTATEMRAALRATVSDAELHVGFNKLSLELATRRRALEQTSDGEKSVELELVDSVWAQAGYDIVPTYLDTMAEQYGAGLKLVDFAAAPDPSRLTINAWVEGQTHGRIVDLLPRGTIVGTTRVVLVNALYLRATWDKPFDAALTTDRAFHTLNGDDVEVPTMSSVMYTAYAEGDDYAVLDLPFHGNELAMSIVLPREGSFESVRNRLSAEWLSTARSAMEETTVSVAVPRFEFTWGESFVDPLKTLGIHDAFEPGIADFSGINTERLLYVSDVEHKAFISVDEDGTEAAAATAVVLGEWGTPDAPPEFTADVPFLVFISDKSGAILFSGQVVDPSAT